MADNRNQVSNGADASSRNQQQRGPQAILNSGRQIQGDVQQLATHVQETTNELTQVITDQMRQRPYTVLATAAGIGYLLGGGLSSRLTLLAFGMATRFAMAMAAREMGSWVTEGFAGDTGGGGGGGGGGGSRSGQGQQKH
ncbi:MAG TPA: hypothetical protein VEC57_12345 [Candidatus Limnocylindrales bacterium]|nr:hypothetical protein [Candidatus Limnocylindrales bacterium]